MDHPYGKQYGQEGNPRAYMTMRDYRNLPYQWQNQQPVGRNPNPNMSLREYRDKYMSGPVYSVPSTYPPPPQYAPPEPPCYAPTSQQQQPPPLSPVEQAILNLSKKVANFIEDNRVMNVQVNRQIETLKSEMELKFDNLRCSNSKLAQQPDQKEEKKLEEESQEGESLIETVLVEQAQLQPQEELEVESLEAPEALQDASVNFWPWTKEKEITALLTEKSSGHEGTQEPIIQPNPQAIPIDLDTISNAKTTYNPLPAAPSTDQVYILPASQSQHKTPAAPKAKSNTSLHAMQNIRRLVASVHTFATTSKTMANAYIAWHSGWFGCGFGFGAPGPRHF